MNFLSSEKFSFQLLKVQGGKLFRQNFDMNHFIELYSFCSYLFPYQNSKESMTYFCASGTSFVFPRELSESE